MNIFRPIIFEPIGEKGKKYKILCDVSNKRFDIRIKKDRSLELIVPCPHCKKTMGVKIFKSGNEIECSNCSKQFYIQIGVISATRGLSGYTAKPVTIRFKKIEGGEDTIEYFGIRHTVDLRNGDVFGAIFKKGLFSSQYNNLIGIMNYTLIQYVLF